MKASGWWRVGILVSGVLFLAACSESVDLFSSMDDRNEVTLSTLDAGSVIRADDSVDVQIRYPSDESSRATRMRVELQDPTGRVHESVEFDRTELAEPRIRSFAFSDSRDQDQSFWGETEDRSAEDEPALNDETSFEELEELEEPEEPEETEETEEPEETEETEETEEPKEPDETEQLENEGNQRVPEDREISEADDPPQSSSDEPPLADDDPQGEEDAVRSTDRFQRRQRTTHAPRDGVYVLVTEAWINNELLLSDRRQIFIASDPPDIERITIHPSTIRREMQALAMADLEYSEATRPYLRWIFDGEVAAEGYLEDRFDRAILDGGDRSKGAYEVKLEVYPWGVEEGVEIDGNTPITASTDVVVGAELLPNPPAFIQQFEGRAVRYFSFDGTRQAWDTDTTDSVEATITGEAYLDMVSGALGVRTGPDGVISAPLPVSDDRDTVHIMAVRISSAGATTSFHDEPVISFGGSDGRTPALPFVVDNGMLVGRPAGGAPIPLGRMPDQYELTTFRFLSHNRDGSTYLEPLFEDGPAGRLIDLGRSDERIRVMIQGGDDIEVFVDRITVTAQRMSTLRGHFVRRGTERLLEPMKTGSLEWALSVPSDWTEAAIPRAEYPEPKSSISTAIDDAPMMHVLLPDGGGISLRPEDADDSGRSIVLSRRGTALEVIDERAAEAQRDQVRIPGDPELLRAVRIQIGWSASMDNSEETVQLRTQQDGQGAFLRLNLPESVALAEIAVSPAVLDANLPVWVGRWVR